jgi:hypothetical protein
MGPCGSVYESFRRSPFEKNGIIDSHKANALHAVPARLPTTGDARVHDVI